MFNTSQVLRFTDRWFDPVHPESFARQGKLFSCVVLVAIFHIIMSIAFVKMQEWEQKHNKHIVRQVEIIFSPLMVAPPEFHKQAAIPLAQVLIPFEEKNTGSKAGAQLGTTHESAELRSDEKVISKIDKLQIETSTQKTVSPNSIISSDAKAPAEHKEQLTLALSRSAKIDHETDASITAPSDVSTDGETDHGIDKDLGRDGSTVGNYGNDNAPPGNEPKHQENIALSSSGNIAPYRKDLLLRIAQNWKPPSNRAVNVIVWLVINKEGRAIMASIIASNASKRTQRETLEAINSTEFAPLPDWCKSDTLSFKIDLRNFE